MSCKNTPFVKQENTFDKMTKNIPSKIIVSNIIVITFNSFKNCREGYFHGVRYFLIQEKQYIFDVQVICFHRFCVEIVYMLLLLLLSSADNLWCVSNHICCSHVLCVERMNNYLRLFHNSYSLLMLLFNFMLPQWSNQIFFFLYTAC